MHTIKISSYHAIYEACTHGFGIKLYVDTSTGRTASLINLAKKNTVEVIPVYRDDINSMSNGQARNAVLLARVPSPVDLSAWSKTLDENKPCLVLVLDHILDPQNLGGLFRTAAHFNNGLLIMSSIRSAFTITDSVLRSSTGAAFSVPFATVKNIAQSLRLLRRAGFWIYGADMDGTPIWQESFPSRTAFVVGSEGSGLSYASKKYCDVVLSLPGSGKVESLNVSVAGGICLYEVYRSWNASIKKS